VHDARIAHAYQQGLVRIRRHPVQAGAEGRSPPHAPPVAADHTARACPPTPDANRFGTATFQNACEPSAAPASLLQSGGRTDCQAATRRSKRVRVPLRGGDASRQDAPRHGAERSSPQVTKLQSAASRDCNFVTCGARGHRLPYSGVGSRPPTWVTASPQRSAITQQALGGGRPATAAESRRPARCLRAVVRSVSPVPMPYRPVARSRGDHAVASTATDRTSAV
jgi:hypothetical protein